MPPGDYDPIGTVQQAITALLLMHEPAFIAIGLRMYLSLATVVIAWEGIRLMFGGAALGDQMHRFARLLLTIAFGYAMIAYYESPIPGLGLSFSNLITDQTAFLASLLSARSVQNAQQSLATLWAALDQPDAWSILANLLYWGMLIVIGLAQFALLFVVCFGMIASAVCALLGPLFDFGAACRVSSAPLFVPMARSRTRLIPENDRRNTAPFDADQADGQRHAQRWWPPRQPCRRPHIGPYPRVSAR